MKKLVFTLALFSTLLSTVSPTKAAFRTWNNTGTNFNTAGSWSGSAVPGAADSAIFATSAATQPNLSASLSILQLSFNTTLSSGYKLTATSGASLTLTATGVTANDSAISNVSTSGFDWISAPIIFGAASGNQNIYNNTAGVLAITGPISATNAVTVSMGTPSAGGTLFVLGANTYSGQTTILGGTTVIDSLGTAGSASSLGTNGTIRFNGDTVPSSSTNQAPKAILRYVGGATTTNNNIDYAGANKVPDTNYVMLAASGFGALTWAGNMTVSDTDTVGLGKNFWLTGVNGENNTFSGSIQDTTTLGGAATELVKNGTGKWVLSGNNTFTGGLTINGGTLVLDYQNGAVVSSLNGLNFGINNNGSSGISLGGNVPISGGTLKLVGKTSGATTQTLGNLSMGRSGQSHIVIDPNGGAGTTLTLGSTWTRDASQQPRNSLLYIALPTGATLTSNPTLGNSLIGGSNSGGWAVVEDSTGIGFATVVGGNVVRYTGATALTNVATSAATNYKFSGNLNMSAVAHSMFSLNVDTTGNGTLDLGGSATTAIQSLLFTGTGNFTLSNGGQTIGNVSFIHQYSSGVVTIDNLGSTAHQALPIAKGGEGTLAVNTRSQPSTDALMILEGALRANGTTVLSAGNIILDTGGVLELTTATGDFTESLGTTAGTIQFNGDGGFSAFGGTRAIRIGNSTASIAWGSTSFVPNDNALVLGGNDSDSTVDFQNGLGLGAQQRVVRVINGTAAVDAKLSGVLSSSYGGGLIKEGAGTLSITGNSNTYIGETWVNEGTLLINGNQSAATGAVKVAAGATLGGTGTVGGATTISGIHSIGDAPGIQTFASDLAYTSGASVNWQLKSNTTTNAANPAAVFDTVVVNGNLNFSGPTSLNLSFVPAGSDVLWSDSFWSSDHLGTDGWLLYDVAGTLTGFGNLSLVTINWLDSEGNAFDTSLFPGAGFSLYQDGNDIYLNYAIPEPGTWLLVAIGVTAVVVFRRRVALR